MVEYYILTIFMKRITTDILIIGAGPAGLATAIKLAEAGKNFVVVEKNAQVGGLSKTYHFDEDGLRFRTDQGPHRFFSKNPKLYAFIEGLINERWIRVRRQTRQFIEGKFYDYPVNALQALRNVGPWRAVRMAADLAVAKIEYGLLRKPVLNFADYVYANFGRSLGEFNMINYTEKIWGLPAAEIHVDWAGQRIKGLSASALVKDALSRLFGVARKGSPKTLVDEFYYPASGTGLIYETIRAKLERLGYTFLMSTGPKKVVCSDNKITGVLCEGPQGEIEITCNTLVESVHLKDFLSLLDPLPPSRVMQARECLRYRSQVYLFITLDKERVTADQWIYFPEKSNPIGRMSEMRNFSAEMSPLGRTSLFLEFFCDKGDLVWNMTAEQLFELALPHLERGGFIRRADVRQYYLLKEANVYPIYDTAYTDYLAEAKRHLDQFVNLYYIGRPGRFRYNNQDHSLEMGFLAARSIIEDKPYDINAVGMEKEYYESGILPADESTSSTGRTLRENTRLVILYVIFAGIATIVDVGLLYIFTSVLGIYYLLSSALSYCAGMLTNYTLNKVLNFRNVSTKIIPQLGVFASVALAGLILNQAIILVLVSRFGIWYIDAKLASVCIVAFWSFWAHKKFTFGLFV